LIAAMPLAQTPIDAISNGNKQTMAWMNNIGGDGIGRHRQLLHLKKESENFSDQFGEVSRFYF
jgi:hypothetical protein